MRICSFLSFVRQGCRTSCLLGGKKWRLLFVDYWSGPLLGGIAYTTEVTYALGNAHEGVAHVLLVL